jgi:hypothetical protein
MLAASQSFGTGAACALVFPLGARSRILVVLGGCVGWVFVHGTPASRRAVLAFLVLAVACYASIALGRGPAFSVLRPASLPQAYIAASRYHYLAQVALALVVTLVLGEIARRLTWTSTTKRVLLGVWVMWTVTGTCNCGYARAADGVKNLLHLRRRSSIFSIYRAKHRPAC